MNINNSMLQSAKDIIIKYNNPSVSLLQVHLKISYDDAYNIIKHLSSIGVLSDYTKPPIKIINASAPSNNISHQVNTIINSNDNFNFDELEGHDFEFFCADILKYNGFTRIKVTSGSGDFGIDILCEKNNISYAIQCKCYSGNVGNHAVQEAVSGKIFYKSDKAVVMTNSNFTRAAEETARLTDAELWGRSIISQMYKFALTQGYCPKFKKMR